MDALPDLDSLWNPLDAAASEAAFRAILPAAEDDLGRHVELQALIARAVAAQARIEEAKALLGDAERLLSHHPDTVPAVARIRWLLEKGRVHILDKTPSQTRPLLAEAWELSVRSGQDYFAVNVAQMMAATEPPKAQQLWIEKAIEIAERSESPKTRRWLGSLYSALGWKQFDLRQYESSLKTFRLAVDHLEHNGTPRETAVARWSTGKVLRFMGRTEEALKIQESLLPEMTVSGERDGRIYEEVAECLHSLQRKDDARIYFEFAYRELSSDEWVSDNQPVKLQRLKKLGEVK